LKKSGLQKELEMATDRQQLQSPNYLLPAKKTVWRGFSVTIYSGNLIWKKQYGKEWAKHYPGSRSAPTVFEDLVYAGTGMGILACLKRETGEIVWKKEYVSDFDGVLPYHGYSEAPVVNGDKVFCTPGGKSTMWLP
jgi:outer membrane protein assembly factor BamB